MTDRFLTSLALRTLLLGSASGAALAGELMPPAGPVSPTMKTFGAVEPRTLINATNTPGDADSVYKITQPGSYYLGEDLIGFPLDHGIEIDAPRVTIDLDGFAIIGDQGSLNGIHLTPQQAVERGIRVFNGVVIGWTVGIDLTEAEDCSVIGVHSLGNASVGIAIGESSMVASCSVEGANSGIVAGAGSEVRLCSSSGADFVGIDLGSNCLASACRVTGSGGIGLRVGDGSIAENCTVEGAANDGIVASAGCVLRACSVSNGQARGLVGASSVVVDDCTAVGNADTGIDLGSNGTVSRCASRANGAGISTGFSAVVESCSVRQNTGNGITFGSRSSAFNCAGYDNDGSGIAASNESMVVRPCRSGTGLTVSGSPRGPRRASVGRPRTGATGSVRMPTAALSATTRGRTPARVSARPAPGTAWSATAPARTPSASSST